MADTKEFNRQKARLRDAVLHDHRPRAYSTKFDAANGRKRFRAHRLFLILLDAMVWAEP